MTQKTSSVSFLPVIPQVKSANSKNGLIVERVRSIAICKAAQLKSGATHYGILPAANLIAISHTPVKKSHPNQREKQIEQNKSCSQKKNANKKNTFQVGLSDKDWQREGSSAQAARDNNDAVAKTFESYIGFKSSSLSPCRENKESSPAAKDPKLAR